MPAGKKRTSATTTGQDFFAWCELKAPERGIQSAQVPGVYIRRDVHLKAFADHCSISLHLLFSASAKDPGFSMTFSLEQGVVEDPPGELRSLRRGLMRRLRALGFARQRHDDLGPSLPEQHATGRRSLNLGYYLHATEAAVAASSLKGLERAVAACQRANARYLEVQKVRRRRAD